MYFLETNLEFLDNSNSTGEEQAYWLVALRAAMIAHELWEAWAGVSLESYIFLILLLYSGG